MRCFFGLPLVLLTLGAPLAAGCGSDSSDSSEPVTETPDQPPADELERELREYAATAAQYMRRDGDALREELIADQSADIITVLQNGWCYKIVAVSAPGVRGFDLRLHDPNGVLVERATSDNRRTHLGGQRPICPPDSGAYRLEVRPQGRGSFAAQVYASM